jgi:hypothetical protein
MKRLAFVSFTIATLIAPTQVQAETPCVRFPQPPNPEAELRYLLFHPGAVVCASPNPDRAGQGSVLQQGTTDSAIVNRQLRLEVSRGAAGAPEPAASKAIPLDQQTRPVIERAPSK